MLMLLNQYYIVFQYDLTLTNVKWHLLEVNITPCKNGFFPFKEVQFFSKSLFVILALMII